MCSCNNILPGSEECYNQQIVLNIPKHMESYKQYKLKNGLSSTICIDPCIVDEIKYLWSLGVTTYGCCCGHNILDSMVNVDEKDIVLMLTLSYEQNHIDQSRKDTFRLKSV